MNSAGEIPTWSAADLENFLQPRPDLAPAMESEIEPIAKLLATNKWPFRIHATYNEPIDRFLNVFERVNGRTPFATRFIIDYVERITERNSERIKALGGGIAIQHRMAFQGEYFVDRYGAEAAKQTPPISKMLAAGLPVGAGTDAKHVSSYDPWVALYWLTTGQTLGDLALVVDRETALRLWTEGSAWFSGEAQSKSTLSPGKYTDPAILSDNYMIVPPATIRKINAVLTMVGGKVVYGEGSYSNLARPLPPASPGWSPVNAISSPAQRAQGADAMRYAKNCHDGCGNHCGVHGHGHGIAWNVPIPAADKKAFWGTLGCSCWAV